MPTVRSRDAHADAAGTSARPAGDGRPVARAVKHALDRVVAAGGLLVTAPLILALALALRIRGGPVLRREPRAGEGGRELALLSFAITREMRGARGWRIVADLGLAALPQLWNVLRGELSIIGPRPRPPGSTPPPARPGLTGLAQVEQLRRELTAREEAELDDRYARTWSPGLDARIVWRTVWRVLP